MPASAHDSARGARNMPISDRITTPARFNLNPARIIRPTVNLPDANAMAFGAVATGSMNAQDAATAAGPASAAKGTPALNARVFRIGINVDVVATLDVSSVRKIITVMTIVTISQVGAS